MSEVFLSYALADRPRAQRVAHASEQQGWAVWWDRHIPRGKTFAQFIEGNLDTAKCVIVLWSKTSVQSDWVQSEADEGKRRDILVPVLIDALQASDIPLEFRRIQAADLADWNDTSDHQGFSDLIEAITGLLGQPEPQTSSSTVPADPSPQTAPLMQAVGNPAGGT